MAVTSVQASGRSGGLKVNSNVVVKEQQAVIVALTDSTGLSGTHNDTLAASTVPADLTGGQSPTETEHNDLLAVVRVMAQNDSDLAQKVNEILVALKAHGLVASA